MTSCEEERQDLGAPDHLYSGVHLDQMESIQRRGALANLHTGGVKSQTESNRTPLVVDWRTSKPRNVAALVVTGDSTLALLACLSDSTKKLATLCKAATASEEISVPSLKEHETALYNFPFCVPFRCLN